MAYNRKPARGNTSPPSANSGRRRRTQSGGLSSNSCSSPRTPYSGPNPSQANRKGRFAGGPGRGGMRPRPMGSPRSWGNQRGVNRRGQGFDSDGLQGMIGNLLREILNRR